MRASPSSSFLTESMSRKKPAVMIVPNQFELFMLMSLICICLFMFFINRETSLSSLAIAKLISQQTEMNERLSTMGTLFISSMATMNEASIVVTDRLNSHDVFLDDFLEIESNAMEAMTELDGMKIHAEDTSEVAIADEDTNDEDESDEEDEDESNEEDEDEESDQMRMLIAHIDAIRNLSQISTTLPNITEESTHVLEPHDTHGNGFTIDVIEDCIIDDEAALPTKQGSSHKAATDIDMIRVKALLKASHVDCRGNNETLLKKFAALQSTL